MRYYPFDILVFIGLQLPYVRCPLPFFTCLSFYFLLYYRIPGTRIEIPIYVLLIYLHRPHLSVR